MFGRARLVARKGLPLMGGVGLALGTANYVMSEAPKPVVPSGSVNAASWSADALVKKATKDPAVVKPPLALQDEFDVVIVSHIVVGNIDTSTSSGGVLE